jgi:hypothetical protein
VRDVNGSLHLFLHFPFNNETHSRVYSDGELTTYMSMQHQALISSELYVQLSAVPSVSWLLCKSVPKMGYKFRKYADMHLIVSEACDKCAAAVALYAQRYSRRRHPDPRNFHAIDRRIKENPWNVRGVQAAEHAAQMTV